MFIGKAWNSAKNLGIPNSWTNRNSSRKIMVFFLAKQISGKTRLDSPIGWCLAETCWNHMRVHGSTLQFPHKNQGVACDIKLKLSSRSAVKKYLQHIHMYMCPYMLLYPLSSILCNICVHAQIRSLHRIGFCWCRILSISRLHTYPHIPQHSRASASQSVWLCITKDLEGCLNTFS